jgi:hypothetical protein
MTLTFDRVRELLRYDPLTGELRWKVSTSNRAPVGSIAGHRVKKEHRVNIKIDGTVYKAHRVIWLWMTGDWPVDEIDHRDRNGFNNIWLNLRAATHQQNMQNKLEIGVHEHMPGKFRTGIMDNGKRKELGVFTSFEEAKKVYDTEKQKVQQW